MDMQTSVTIRRAAKADIPEIIRLLILLGEYHIKLKPELCRAAPTPRKKKTVKKSMLRPKNRAVYLAVDAQGHACGLLYLSKTEMKTSPVLLNQRIVKVEDLFVEEGMRGRGIGKALMAQARQAAKEYKADSLTLEVWEYNKASQRFYANEGFTTWNKLMWLNMGEE